MLGWESPRPIKRLVYSSTKVVSAGTNVQASLVLLTPHIVMLQVGEKDARSGKKCN